eukprot:553004-Pelagomonas_calceolata.AAC.1
MHVISCAIASVDASVNASAFVKRDSVGLPAHHCISLGCCHWAASPALHIIALHCISEICNAINVYDLFLFLIAPVCAHDQERAGVVTMSTWCAACSYSACQACSRDSTTSCPPSRTQRQ